MRGQKPVDDGVAQRRRQQEDKIIALVLHVIAVVIAVAFAGVLTLLRSLFGSPSRGASHRCSASRRCSDSQRRVSSSHVERSAGFSCCGHARQGTYKQREHGQQHHHPGASWRPVARKLLKMARKTTHTTNMVFLESFVNPTGVKKKSISGVISRTFRSLGNRWAPRTPQLHGGAPALR